MDTEREGAKWGQVQGGLPGHSGAFEDLETRAGLTAFPFSFLQSLQIQASYSRSLDSRRLLHCRVHLCTGMLQWACWVVMDPEYHHGSEATPSREFHSLVSWAGPVGLAKGARSEGLDWEDALCRGLVGCVGV